jgi:1-acyl-sn-glycerol-3-phosphate acyltransferase
MAQPPESASPKQRRIGSDWVYWPAAGLARCLFTVIGRVRVFQAGRFPKQGGCLLASNHVSHFDPPILSAYLRRRIDWLAMADLFQTSLARKFLDGVGAISIERNQGDRAALRNAIERLRLGRVVGIFPEGGIRDGERSIVNGGSMQPGAAMIAAHAGMPVVPVATLGTERFYNLKHCLPWRRTPVWIGIGEPITPMHDLPRDEARERLRLEMAKAFVHLRDSLREKFALTDADLPHSPQERMREP